MRGGLWGAPKIIYDKKEKSQKIKLLVWHKHIYTSSCLFFFWVCVTFHSFFCLAAAAAAAQLWEFLLGGLVSLDHFRLGRLHNSTRDNNNNSQKSKKKESDTISNPAQAEQHHSKSCLALQFPLPILLSHARCTHQCTPPFSFFFVSVSVCVSMFLFNWVFVWFIYSILHYLAHGFLADDQPV